VNSIGYIIDLVEGDLPRSVPSSSSCQ